jgi:hypothetical protein
MADDRSNRGRPDRDRIDVHQPHELRYWAQKFGVTAEELERAVQDVGPMATRVEEHLRAGR